MGCRTKNPDRQYGINLKKKFDLNQKRQSFSSYINEVAGNVVILGSTSYTIASDGSYRLVGKKEKTTKGPKG